MGRVTPVIDSDQHLYETRTTWLDHIDPAIARRRVAHRRRRARLPVVELAATASSARSTCSIPGQTSELGRAARAHPRPGLPPLSNYDDDLPRDYWDASARADRLAEMGVDEAVVFPNFGLLWERTLDENLACAHREHDGVEPVVRVGRRRRSRVACIPVAHLTLRDEPWLHRRARAASSVPACTSR